MLVLFKCFLCKDFKFLPITQSVIYSTVAFDRLDGLLCNRACLIVHLPEPLIDLMLVQIDLLSDRQTLLLCWALAA